MEPNFFEDFEIVWKVHMSILLFGGETLVTFTNDMILHTKGKEQVRTIYPLIRIHCNALKKISIKGFCYLFLAILSKS